MTLGIMDLGEAGLALLIPREIIDHLGWVPGSEIVADVRNDSQELIIYKKDSPEPQTLGGVKEIVTPK